ncbi:FixH family protein [Paenibacillus soyae]|uniref:FixH family protein n=1 Tax=Paenibacillus soyae TaxID=2969249 RepID=A0A9X2MMC4_9BACL|nr:FixH family protein [Paenibacillus soyae]MCR2802754.1 FixH family protein [Paenibacillus soyae]
MIKRKRNQTIILAGTASLLLLGLLCGCTARTPSGADENGLHPHVTVEMSLPETFEIGRDAKFTLEAKKNGELLANADSAEFVFWPEGHKDAAVIVPAEEISPGEYAASYTVREEGVYVVQSRLRSAGEIIMPAKRFAIGPEAVDLLIQLEEAQKNDAPAAAGGGHHH